MRTILFALALFACTPTSKEKTDGTIAVKAVACSAGDYARAKAIIEDTTKTAEQKIIDLALQIGPDVMGCITSAVATTAPAQGSGSASK